MNLNPLYKHFKDSPESTWIMQFPNAVDLYNFIIKHPIKKVLALGTGIGFSDAVIALAFKEKKVEGAIIDSIEQFDKCIKLANELIPEDLKKYINIIKSEPEIWTTDKMPYQYFSIYKELPDKQYDLIINDGPGPFTDKYGNLVELPNGTIQKLTIEEKIKPDSFVIYDGRIPSLNLIERYLDSCYYLYRMPARGSDFFILQRKNTPAVVKDTRLQAFKDNTTYLKNHENIISSDQSCTSGKTAITDKGTPEKA